MGQEQLKSVWVTNNGLQSDKMLATRAFFR